MSGARPLSIAVAIKTRDRSPRENYLGRTLESLGAAGVWKSPHLDSLTYIDSGSEDWREFRKTETAHRVPAGFPSGFDSEIDRTLHQTAREAIRLAGESGADYALVLEDDIAASSDFLESVALWLSQHADPTRYPFYVFGANYSQLDNAHTAGRTLWPYPLHAFYGAQAIAFTADAARDFAEWAGPDPSYLCSKPCCSSDGQPVATRDRHHDLLLAQWATERGHTHAAASVPSFVQHVGVDSTLDNAPFTFSTYSGPNWHYRRSTRRPSVLFVGDAACSTGFARCTHAACDALDDAGWDVSVLAINYYGDPSASRDYPYDIYPARDPLDGGSDEYGNGRLPILVDRLGPELVVFLNDSWNIRDYLIDLRRRNVSLPASIGWIAVDAENQAMAADLNYLDHVATWTEFGAQQLAAGGYTGTPTIVPLGVDLDTFRPHDRAEARSWVYSRVPPDAFVVGTVCRNQSRKRIDLILAAFAQWVREYEIPDAYLHLHVAVGQRQHCADIPRLIHYYGIDPERVIHYTPHTGQGLATDRLPRIYSAMDCYLTMSQGEGWGLPVLEAMACGVPCIVPDFAALGEWPGDAAVRIPCPTTALSAPLNSLAFTVGRVPDVEEAVGALEGIYRSPGQREELRSRGLAKAAEYPWSRTGREFVAVCERVLGSRGFEAPADEPGLHLVGAVGG